MPPFDYIHEAKLLSQQLSQSGRHEDADKIDQALCEGSTGNEICMMLRYYLKNMLDQAGFEEPLKSKLTQLYTELDSILKDVS